MKKKNSSMIVITFGVLLLINFPLRVLVYINDGYVTPGLFEPVYGSSAKIVLFFYGLLAIFGIYLIITGIKRKNNNKDEEKQ